MATELDTNKNANDLTKKLWEKHQADEYTHVDNYKEAVCINCFKRDATSATIADICGDCAGKRGREVEQINARFCRSCHRRIANVTKEYNKKGGLFGADPFWVKMRKKHGKDWMHIMSKNLGNKR